MDGRIDGRTDRGMEGEGIREAANLEGNQRGGSVLGSGRKILGV